MKFLPAAISLSLLLLSPTAVTAAPAWDTYSDTWAATDGLGRALPDSATTGAPRDNKTAGIFYFLWNEGQNPVYDLTKLTAASPENPAYGKPGAFHHWGEPLFGYYRQDDRYVIRKHLQMLTDAGIDVLFLDVTNALTYDSVRDALLEVMDENNALGMKTPTIAFLTNSDSARTVTHLYETFFKPGKGRAHWAMWLGKPLLLTPPDGLSDEIKAFFTIRHSWAWTKGHKWFGDGRDKWPWLDHTPQTPGWTESPDKPEQIVVCSAEHPISNIGRSFHNRRQPAPENRRTAWGAYFEEQWERALKVDPSLVFVTGWNEWIAQRFIDEGGTMSMGGKKLKPGDTYFVDQFSDEYSRDLEPMKGGFGDAYYYQLAANVRRYKGARAVEPLNRAPAVIDGAFRDWEAVTPEFRDTLGDPARRKHPGWVGEPEFVNDTGRNDIAAAKVTVDDSTLSFHVRTREPLTAPAAHWMQLCLDTDANAATGWLGCDFIVNRTPPVDGNAVIERVNADGTFTAVEARIPIRWADNALELSVPAAALGGAPAEVRFKWLDNIPAGAPAESLTLNGDAAPNDRFQYRAILKEPSGKGEKGS